MKPTKFAQLGNYIGRKVKFLTTSPLAGTVGYIRSYYPGIPAVGIELQNGLTTLCHYPWQINFYRNPKKNKQ